jgi:hypothetical protein
MNAIRLLLETTVTGPKLCTAVKYASNSSRARGRPSKRALIGTAMQECRRFRLTNWLPHWGHVHIGRVTIDGRAGSCSDMASRRPRLEFMLRGV